MSPLNFVQKQPKIFNQRVQQVCQIHFNFRNFYQILGFVLVNKAFSKFHLFHTGKHSLLPLKSKRVAEQIK